jgi:hypothetical protein
VHDFKEEIDELAFSAVSQIYTPPKRRKRREEINDQMGKS